MRLFLKSLKIILAVTFTAYSLFLGYQLLLAPKEQRFQRAGNMQGFGLSQAMSSVLNWQYPDYSDPYFERSVAYNKRGDYATGFRYLDQAVKLQPEKHLGYRGYMKLRFLRDYEAALLDFDRLDSLTPDVVDAPWGEDIDFLRGESHFGLKDYQKALAHFEQSVLNQGSDWADVQTFVFQGLCNHELGNYEEAILSFQKALAQYENTCEAHYGLARTYLQLGDTIQAAVYLKMARNNISYKREDPYKEFLNEIYIDDIDASAATVP